MKKTQNTSLQVKDEQAGTVLGPVLRLLVCRSGDLSLDVISIPESVIDEHYLGDVEGFVHSLYNICNVDWWCCAPVKGIPVRIMEFGPEDEPEGFLFRHHDDKRKFI